MVEGSTPSASTKLKINENRQERFDTRKHP